MFKRRDVLRWLGLSAVAAVVPPAALAKPALTARLPEEFMHAYWECAAAEIIALTPKFYPDAAAMEARLRRIGKLERGDRR